MNYLLSYGNPLIKGPLSDPGWAQVELLCVHILTGVVIAGSGFDNYWTETFRISYSNSTMSNFTEQTDENGTTVVSIIFVSAV